MTSTNEERRCKLIGLRNIIDEDTKHRDGLAEIFIRLSYSHYCHKGKLFWNDEEIILENLHKIMKSEYYIFVKELLAMFGYHRTLKSHKLKKDHWKGWKDNYLMKVKASLHQNKA